MKIKISDYQGKGFALRPYLPPHTLVEDPPYDLLLTDSDSFPDTSNKIAEIRAARECGAKVAVYPHGPYPGVSIFTVRRLADVYLVTGPGNVLLWHLLAPSVRVVDIGWYLCPLLPLEQRRSPRNVLFAPIHTVIEEDEPSALAANREGMEIAESFGVPVTVRGREPRPAEWDEIDAHDTVVAEGTFAMLALARGKRVYMFGPPRDRSTWPLKRYWQLTAYSERWSRSWRASFIGTQTTAERLREALTL